MSGYEEFRGGRVPIRAWVRGVPVEKEALQQLRPLLGMQDGNLLAGRIIAHQHRCQSNARRIERFVLFG